MSINQPVTGFQTKVNLTQAPAVAGDYASSNPRASVLAGPGALIAGPEGVTVGKFAWIAADGMTVHNYGTGTRAPDGFVHRDQQGLITQYLSGASMIIPQGFPVVLMNEGDFYAQNYGPSASTLNEAIYAEYSTGNAYMGAAPTGASGTASMGSTNTAAIGSTSTGTATGTSLVLTSLTGYVSIGDTVAGTGVPAGTTIVSQTSGTTGAAGTYVTSQVTTASSATITTYGSVLVTSSTTGLISVGETVSGGAGFPTAATIVSQISGTTGGAGHYQLSAPATAYVASATGVTTFGNFLDVTAVSSGNFLIGDAVSGTGIPTGANIASFVSGTSGGVGVYTLNLPASTYAASTTVTVVDGVQTTNFKAKSVNAVGELVKISTWG